MAYIGWRFPPLCGGSRQGYTKNDIEAFKGEELIDNLAREICQNSLDAAVEGNENPVKVVFELKYVNSKNFPVFEGYGQCIRQCRDFWGDKADSNLETFLDNAENMLKNEQIPILVAGDYNTEGLPGSRSGDISTKWEALTGSEGVSVKSSETSGGSFGIGKNAPFACSALSMVFYNTFVSDEDNAFVGVGKLAALKNGEGKETQSIGKYQVNDDEGEIWTPIFGEDQDDFRDLFIRSEQGTDVIIVGFIQASDWIDSVAKAVLKNFFVAVNEGRLVVELKEGKKHTEINQTTLSQTVTKYSDDPEMTSTAQLYRAYTDPDKREYLTIIDENDAEIFVKTDVSFNRAIAYFRDNGMLIQKKRKQILQHYAAVFIVRGEKLSKLLRATEPARHNMWDYKRISGNDPRRSEARKALNKIDDKLLDLLKSQFEMPVETTLDAEGVGEYLPDDSDLQEGTTDNNDILNVKVKIGKIKTEHKDPGKVVEPGEESQGTGRKGEVHNRQPNPTPTPHVHIPHVVDPKVDENPEPGTGKGEGEKIITSPNLSKQRAFPVNSSQGLYKIIIVPDETYDDLFISCSAFGEDGRTDLLEIESFMFNGKPVTVKNSKAGPIKVEANKAETFFVRFAEKEKMVLSLHITEELEK